MPHYFFHLQECGSVTRDEEGCDLSGFEAARDRAIMEARAIMGAEVSEGKLCMACDIAVEDGDGRPVLMLPFKEAVVVSGL